ncbi:unnamed protein product [Cyprideis torosa]|uniref:Uncharacterized protein n=1 Tax=Cyprideis torosa TaxID=163714 RepID=A0A7R8WCR3_9CRUS|nr:unnamed protein product [Cyprideis torosa]CAG0893688.1 unnamed protein product [Cyprideis torosa]
MSTRFLAHLSVPYVAFGLPRRGLIVLVTAVDVPKRFLDGLHTYGLSRGRCSSYIDHGNQVLNGVVSRLSFLFEWFEIYEIQHPNRLMAGVAKSLLSVFSESFSHRPAEDPNKFRTLPSYPGVPFSNGRKSNTHIEGWFGLIGSTLNVAEEIIIGAGFTNPTDHMICPDNVMHVILMLAVVLRSLAVLLSHSGKVPKQIEYIATGFAGIVEMPMFMAHAYLKDAVTGVVLHVGTGILFFMFGSLALYEMKHPNHLMASLTKCYCLILTGVFISHTGDFLTHVEPFKGNHMFMDGQSQILYLMLYFILDALAVAVVIIGIAVWVKIHYFPEVYEKQKGLRVPRGNNKIQSFYTAKCSPD